MTNRHMTGWQAVARFSGRGFTQSREAAKAQSKKEKESNATESEVTKVVVDAATNRPKNNNFNIRSLGGLLIRLGIVDGLVRTADRKMDDRNIFLSPIFLSS